MLVAVVGVAAEIVAVVVAVVVVGTAEVGSIGINWLDFVAGLDFAETGIVSHFCLVLVYSLEILLLTIPVVAADVVLPAEVELGE